MAKKETAKEKAARLRKEAQRKANKKGSIRGAKNKQDLLKRL